MQEASGTDLIGRDAELETVVTALTRRHAAIVVGEPGIGKTALLRSAARIAGGRVYEGGALALLSDVPLLAVRRALRRDPPAGDAATVAEFVEVMVGDGILVLDDLQWADGATREVAQLLAGRTRLVAAMRPPAVAVEGFDVVRLDALDPESAAALVRSRAPDLDGDGVRRVVAQAAGSPLLLEELAAAPAGSTTLRMAVSARLADLPAAQRRAVERLALLERPAPPARVGADAEVLGAAGLVVVAADGIALRHSLIAEVARQAMDAGDRSGLHRELVALAESPAEAARHLLAAGDRAGAREAALAAAGAATRQDERAMLLALAASCTDGSAGDELRVRAAEEALHAGAYADALRVLDAVAADAGALAARAALAQAEALWESGRAEDAAAALRLGAEVEGAGPALASRIELARIRQRAWEWDGGLVDAAEAAWAAAEAGGWAEPRDLVTVGIAHLVAFSPAALALALRARDLARAADDAAVEAEAIGIAAAALLNRGRTAEAYELVLEAETLLRRLGLGRRLLGTIQTRANLELWARGDYRASLDLSERLLDRGQELGVAVDSVRAHRALALADTGRLGEAHELLEGRAAAARSADGAALLSWIAGEVHWLEGRAEEVVRSAAAALDVGETPYHAPARCLAGWGALATGRPVVAGESMGTWPEATMYAKQLEAVAALAGERWDAARVQFAAAAEAADGISVRDRLRARLGLGLAAQGAGDRSQARSVLLALEEELAGRGMVALLARVRGGLRRAGVHRATGAAAGEGLTGREREIIALVGDGLTSAEIAGRLGIGRSTVETHVRSAMRKLGTRTRVQAAAALGG